MSRTENSLKNLRFSIFFKIAGIILTFLARKIFVRILSAEYLGLNGTFSNVLTMLSLVELGVGSAITFSLYRPLAENDRTLVLSIMKLYKKLYTIIGITVAVLGAALTPFLPHLVKEMPDIPHISLIYLMFVFNSAISYFFVYKQTLIDADQKNYIITTYNCTVGMSCTILQCVVLLLTHNYFLYLGLTIAQTIVSNVLLARKADRLYPFLNDPDAAPLPQETKTQISKNVSGMVLHKVGAVIVFGTDNLLLAKIFGVVSVGIYSNYTLVTESLKSATTLLFRSLTASVGNLNAAEDRDYVEQMFWRIDRFSQWLFGFCSICLFALLNPLIGEIWLGEEWLFPVPIVFVIVLNFYINGMRQSNLLFTDAMGLYWEGRYKPVAESIINLAVSILLALRYGVIGVFIGTFVSMISTDFWIEPRIVFRHGLKRSPGRYFTRYAFHTAVTFAAGFVTVFLCGLLPSGLLAFLGKMMICAIVPNLIYFLVYFRTEEFGYFKELLTRILSKLVKKDTP